MSNLHRRYLAFGVLASLLLLFLLTGCSEKKSLRVGIHPWIGYEPLYQADEFGWISPLVTLQKGKTFVDSFAGLLRGELDAAALTLDEFFIARAQGIPLRVITICNVSAGADVVAVRDTIPTLGELAGKRIAVEKNALGELMLAQALEAAGLSRDEVEIVPLRIDEQLDAWLRGDIDAAISYEPTASRLRQAGAVILFNSRQIPEIIFDLIAVRDDRIKGREAAIRDLLEAHYRGLEHFVINRQDALYRVSARQEVSYDEARYALGGIVLPSLEGNRYYLSPDSRFVRASETVARLMVDHQIIPVADTLHNLYDNRFLPRTKEKH